MAKQKTWTADDAADHFEEAFRTLRKLPPVKARGYFTAWPQIDSAVRKGNHGDGGRAHARLARRPRCLAARADL
jgi:hypothetical protein